MKALTPAAAAVTHGCHASPFRFLGPHVDAGRGLLRVFLPNATEGALYLRLVIPPLATIFLVPER